MQEFKVCAGQSFNVAVPVSAQPPPKITWTYKDERMENGERVKVVNQARLTIKRALRSDTGTFVINAENEFGTNRAEVHVTVFDRPGPPEGPLNVTEVHSKGCTLSWKPPLDDGGAEVSGYIVEKQDLYIGRWQVLGEVADTKFIATDLTPQHEYKFRVKAVNRYGESDPFETAGSIVAKNPFDEPTKPDIDHEPAVFWYQRAPGEWVKTNVTETSDAESTWLCGAFRCLRRFLGTRSSNRSESISIESIIVTATADSWITTSCIQQAENEVIAEARSIDLVEGDLNRDRTRRWEEEKARQLEQSKLREEERARQREEYEAGEKERARREEEEREYRCRQRERDRDRRRERERSEKEGHAYGITGWRNDKGSQRKRAEGNESRQKQDVGWLQC